MVLICDSDSARWYPARACCASRFTRDTAANDGSCLPSTAKLKSRRPGACSIASAGTMRVLPDACLRRLDKGSSSRELSLKSLGEHVQVVESATFVALGPAEDDDLDPGGRAHVAVAVSP